MARLVWGGCQDAEVSVHLLIWLKLIDSQPHVDRPLIPHTTDLVHTADTTLTSPLSILQSVMRAADEALLTRQQMNSVAVCSWSFPDHLVGEAVTIMHHKKRYCLHTTADRNLLTGRMKPYPSPRNPARLRAPIKPLPSCNQSPEP